MKGQTRTTRTGAVSKYFRPYWHPPKTVLGHLDTGAYTLHPSPRGMWCGVIASLSNCLTSLFDPASTPRELGQWGLSNCPRREEET